MRFEYTEISDIRENPYGRRSVDIFQDQNDIVQDIPEDVEDYNALELEPEVQDIPEDYDWNEMARGKSQKEMNILAGTVDDAPDHFNDEGDMPKIQDHFNDEGDMPKIQDHFNDEGDMPDVPDHLNDEDDIDDIQGHLHTERTDQVRDNLDINKVMEDFKPENWEGLSDVEKKEALEKLGEYAAADLGLENPPKIEFYQEDNPGDFGAYSEAENTIYINELNMSDPAETADTITHETRHCWQHERAEHPQSEQDYAFANNFANYVTPDTDFEAYQDQIVESDARDYADRYRALINS